MKKILFASSVLILISMSFTSCRKCEICTKDSAPEIRICEGDYDSNTQYGLALDALEVSGYECR